MTATGSEFALIERYFRRQPPALARDDVVLGIGDDCALLKVPPDRQLSVSLDVLVSGQHFFADADPQGVGHKALAVNLSDLAAVASEPAWVTLGLTLPQPDEVWLAGFCEGFFALAERHKVALVGGDTSRGPLSIAVQAHGFVAPGRALRRDGAQPGDLICVTGTLGDAALALSVAATATAKPKPLPLPLASEHLVALRHRLERPTPRVVEGQALAGLASAAIDVSDGFAQDLAHVLAASGVGARIEPEQLPLSAAARAWPQPRQALQAALSGGDDYELCFTLPPDELAPLRRLAADWDCDFNCCGVVEAAPGLRLASGYQWLSVDGYQHFV